MGTGYETVSRYLYISISNLFAFFIYIGVPTTSLWVRELVNVVRNAKKKIMAERNFDNYLLAYVITLIGIDFASLYSLETERVWMFMAPFILIPAAKHLAVYIEEKRNLRMFYVVAALLCIQILAFEIFLNTWS